MADFLGKYCGEYGNGNCRCSKRVNYAIQSHRINPLHLDYTSAKEIPEQTLVAVKDAMEHIDDLSQQFSFCKSYQPPEKIRKFFAEFMDGAAFSTIKNT